MSLAAFSRSVIALLLLLPLLTSVIIVRRGEPVVPLYRVTFNDTAPFGADEDTDSTSDCTTHGALFTDTARFDCEYGSAQEGDGCLQHDGVNLVAKTTAWYNKWTGVDVTWVEVWIYFDEAVIGLIDFMLFVSGFGSYIGTDGYYIHLGSAGANTLRIICDDSQVSWTDGYIDQTWGHYLFRVDLANGDIDAWLNDFTGSPDKACDGTGSDTGTPFNGFAIQGRQLIFDEMRIDDINIYDEDPR